MGRCFEALLHLCIRLGSVLELNEDIEESGDEGGVMRLFDREWSEELLTVDTRC